MPENCTHRPAECPEPIKHVRLCQHCNPQEHGNEVMEASMQDARTTVMHGSKGEWTGPALPEASFVLGSELRLDALQGTMSHCPVQQSFGLQSGPPRGWRTGGRRCFGASGASTTSSQVNIPALPWQDSIRRKCVTPQRRRPTPTCTGLTRKGGSPSPTTRWAGKRKALVPPGKRHVALCLCEKTHWKVKQSVSESPRAVSSLSMGGWTKH